MIVWNLDGTLANCEHRLHFIREPDMWIANPEFVKNPMQSSIMTNPEWRNFKPNWNAFYEACDKDKPIRAVCDILRDLSCEYDYEIWSGRCESVRDKTEKWIQDYLYCTFNSDKLRMRPIGDYTPDDQLKERWLYEALAKGEKIDFVFDSDAASISMWKSRGVFVFDCRQDT